MNKRLDNARVTLNEYINYHKTKLNAIKGSGIKGRRRKQRGGNVMFFNDVKQLLFFWKHINSDEKYGSQYIGHIIENVNNK